MAVPLLRFFYWALSTLSNLLSFLCIRSIAMLVVAAIRLLKLPAPALSFGKEQAKEVIKSGIGNLHQFFTGYGKDAVAYVLDLVTQAVSSSVGLMASAAGELVEKTKTMMDEIGTVVPEVLNCTAEMVGDVAAGLWENYKDGIAYVTEKIKDD